MTFTFVYGDSWMTRPVGHAWVVQSGHCIGLWRKSPKLRRRQIVPKQLPPTHIWSPLTISLPKVKKIMYGIDGIVPSCRYRLSVPWQKYTYFPYRRLPWGLPSHAIFGKLSLSRVTPRLTCNAATYRFRDTSGQNLGFWGGLEGTPGKPLCPGPMSTIIQNFTAIGVSVAEICNRTHIKVERITADKSHIALRLSIKITLRQIFAHVCEA